MPIYIVFACLVIRKVLNTIIIIKPKMEEDRPLDALNNARNKKVIVELKNGKQIVGKLKSFDIHINVVLDDAQELENGEVKRKIGTSFVRGDTIVLISPE